MCKIIKIVDAKSKKLTAKEQHYRALSQLVEKLSTLPSPNHEEVICSFIISCNTTFKTQAKTLEIFIDLIAQDSHLKIFINTVLKTLSAKAQKKIINLIRDTWPNNKDAVLRLIHISQLADYWAKQSPDIPFSQIIPTDVVFEFLRNCEK